MKTNFEKYFAQQKNFRDEIIFQSCLQILEDPKNFMFSFLIYWLLAERFSSKKASRNFVSRE